MQQQEVDARIGQGWRDLSQGFRDSDCGRAGTQLIETLRARVLELVTDAAQTRRDIDLSDIGRERKLRRLGAQARSDEAVTQALELWHDSLAEREGLLKRAIAEATRVTAPTELFEISLDSEIRAHLRGLDREQRLALLDQAARHGETQPLRAVFTAPPFLSGLSDSEANHIRQRAAGAKAGPETGELEMLERAGDLIRGAERSFERIVLELTEDPGSGWRTKSERDEGYRGGRSRFDHPPRFEN